MLGQIKVRTVIHRVANASVRVESKVVGGVEEGWLVFGGIEEADSQEDLDWLVTKIAQLRIFNDENEVMNLSVQDIDGDVLVVSQFTLHAATKKGNRPSYIKAAKPDIAIPMYERFVKALESKLGKKVSTGIFGADMKVLLLNDGPVTIQMDSKNKE